MPSPEHSKRRSTILSEIISEEINEIDLIPSNNNIGYLLALRNSSLVNIFSIIIYSILTDNKIIYQHHTKI